MPRNGSGVMSWPPNTQGVPNTKVSSTRYNAFLADLLQDLNAARPINAGGTGGNTAISGNDGLNTTGADMPSAGTLNLANATGVVVNVTGTTTITALGTVNSGAFRTLVFAGSLTLTHNAASLILPTGANIQTAAGDVASFRSKGAGNWVCVDYQRANGRSLSAILDSPTFNGTTTLVSTDPAPATGPTINFRRDAILTAGTDFAQFNFISKDSANNDTTFGRVFGRVTNSADGAEGGELRFQTVVAGAVNTRLVIGAGLFASSLTDPGAGKANFAGFSVNNNPLWAAPDCVLEDQKAAGSSGGSGTTAAWTTRVLNTKVRDPYSLISLSSNQFTSTVDGWVEWVTTFCRVNSARSRLYNVTDSAVVSLSMTDFTTDNSSAASNVPSVGCGAVVAGKTYRIEYWMQVNGGGAAGLGYSNTTTTGTEIYSRLKFWRA